MCENQDPELFAGGCAHCGGSDYQSALCEII